MTINIQIKGLTELIKRFRQAPKIIDEETNIALNQSLFLIERNVKLRTPVDTGRLRSSIGGGVFKGGAYPEKYGWKVGRRIAEIGTKVKYAFWVEVRPARHIVGEVGYFSKGVQTSINGINQFFVKAMQRVAQRVTK